MTWDMKNTFTAATCAWWSGLRIEDLLPADCLRITLSLVDDHTRELSVQAKAAEY